MLRFCPPGIPTALCWTAGAKSEKKDGDAVFCAPPSRRCQSMGTAETILPERKRLPDATSLNMESKAEIPKTGGMIPKPVRLILAAATGSAAMPTQPGWHC